MSVVPDPHPRYLRAQVADDLERKMVFLSGPRQVGKTTLALALPGGKAGYLTWDDPDDRDRILRRRLPRSPLWVFDEIHKYRPWRGYLKGLFDKRSPAQRMLVSGSIIARMSKGWTWSCATSETSMAAKSLSSRAHLTTL